MTLKRKKQEMAKRKPALEKASRLMVEDFEPRTENQENYVISMSQNEITICVGPPGCGKTFCSVGLACSYLCDGRVDELIFSRPIVGCGKGIGTLPGTLWEKTEVYFVPIIDCLEFFLGKDQYRSFLLNNTIKFIPLELMRGMSIKNTFLVLDESNNADTSQLKMLLSRLDVGSKFVLNGDYKQSDLKNCDFRDCVNKLREKNIKNLGFCELTEEDNQRRPIINSIMRALEE